MEPAPNNPNPPQLLTADASRQPEHHTIPACTMGYLIPNNLQILFSDIYTDLSTKISILMQGNYKICHLLPYPVKWLLFSNIVY